MCSRLSCIFCKWVYNDQELKKLEKENRLLNPNDIDGYLAVLDKDPKVAGHTLIISTEHYDDITELNDDETDIFKGVVKWAKQIKNKLNEFGVKKVYVLSMCDHWTDNELRDRCTHHSTEHLHFHLVPRWDFDKEIRGEEVLIRGVPLKSEELKSKKLGPKIKFKREEIFNLLKETRREGH